MEYNTIPTMTDFSATTDQILDALNIPMVIIDREARIQKCFGETEAFLKCTEPGSNILEAVHAEIRNYVSGLIKNLQVIQDPIEVAYVKKQHEKHESKFSKIKLSPLRSHKSNLSCFLLQFEPSAAHLNSIIREDTKLRKKLVRVQDTIGKLSKSSNYEDEFLCKAVKVSLDLLNISETAVVSIEYQSKIYKTDELNKAAKVAGFITTDEIGNDVSVDLFSKYNGRQLDMFSEKKTKLFEVFAKSIFTGLNDLIVKRKLAESEAKLNTLYESESECVKFVSQDGILLDMNTAGLCMIEAIDNPDLAIGQKVIQLVHPEDQQIFQNLHDKALHGRKSTARFRIIGLQGTERLMESTSVPLKFGADGEIAVLSITRDISDKIKDEEHLRLLETVIAHTNDAVVISDATPLDKGGPTVVYVNKAFTRLTGFLPEDVIGKKSRLTTTKYSNRPEIQKLIDAYNQGKSYELTTLNFKKNGEEFWAGINLSPVRNDKGEITHWLAIEKDVTANVTEELQEILHSNIRKVFSDTPNLKNTLHEVLKQIGFCFEDQIAELWLKGIKNKHIHHAATYASDDTAQAFFASDCSMKLKTGLGFAGTVWESGKTMTFQMDCQNDRYLLNESFNKSGVNYLIGIPLKQHDEFVGVLVVGSDKIIQPNTVKYKVYQSLEQILGTEIKRKQQEEELHLLFESAPEILATVSPEGHFTKANPAFCKLLEYTEEEIINNPFEKFIHPDDLKETLTEYSDNIAGTRHADNYINRYRTKSGAIKWISWYSSETFGDDGHMFAFGRDVTKIVKLEQLLENTAKLAKVGSWELDLTKPDNDKMYWSPMIKEIFEVAPDLYPSISNGLQFFTPESKELGLNAIENLIQHGQTFDLELLLHTAKGNKKWVRAIGKSDRLNGSCLRIYGSFQDINNQKLLGLSLSEKTGQLKAITKIISNFLQHEDWYEALSANFKIAGTLLNVDRVAYFENHLEKGTNNKLYSQRFEWSQTDDLSHRDNPFLQNIPFEVFSDYITPLENGDLYIANTEDLPNGSLKKVFEFQDMKSTVAIPIFIENRFFGFIGFDDCKSKRTWTEDEIDFMKSIASNLASAVQRKLNRLELEEAYHENNTILESIGDGFFAVDNDWTVTYWNNIAEKLLKTPKEEILGKNLWERFAGKLDARSYKQYIKALKSGKAVNFEEYIQPLDKWFEVSAYPGAKGLSVYFKDVTERRSSALQLQKSNERFEKVTEATNDAIWDWDVQQNSLYWGSGYFRLFGHDVNRPNLNIIHWRNLVHPDDLSASYESVQAAINNPGQTKWESEYRLRRADGSYANVMDRGVIIRDRAGKAIRMLGAMSDVTAQKQYEVSLKRLNANLEKQARELALSNEELEQFAYVASHDLQEPLRMVTSFLTQLNKKYGDQLDDKAQKYIFYAVDGAKRMRQIILDLLEFSRVGKHDSQISEVAIADIVNEVELLNKRLIQNKNATIEKNNLPVIQTYYAPVLQIFQNIISNALKYSKPDVKPHISIHCTERKNHWEFSISDNGIGIQQEYFDRIFVIFQRLHTKSEIEGTGMGLSIVKKIVENLGGNIWLESTYGEGSTFYFTISKQSSEQ